MAEEPLAPLSGRDPLDGTGKPALQGAGFAHILSKHAPTGGDAQDEGVDRLGTVSSIARFKALVAQVVLDTS